MQDVQVTQISSSVSRQTTNQEVNILKSNFVLKTGTNTTPQMQRKENNKTAIGFSKYMEGKGQQSEKYTEQIVFAKEFKGRRASSEQRDTREQHRGHQKHVMANQQLDKETERKKQESLKIQMEAQAKVKDQARQEAEREAKLKIEEEKKRILEIQRQSKARKEEQARQETERQAKYKIEAEKKRILEEERVRLETFEQERQILQQKRAEILTQDNDQRIKEGLKKSLINVSRQEQQGVGFGSVHTGFVINQKRNIMVKASSVEPPPSATTESPAASRRSKNVRYVGYLYLDRIF